MNKLPPLTVGIEEEFQLVDPRTLDLHPSASKLFADITPDDRASIKPEFMQSQVEIGSNVCKDITEIRAEVVRLRNTVHTLADKHNLAIVSASSHPFAKCADQRISVSDRSSELLENMQGVARQLLIFGMHVHVGFGHHKNPANQEVMIKIMNQARYFLPHLLALSTSSPFWEGNNTGLKSYRSVIFEMFPRTGIPPHLTSWAEYKQYEQTLSGVGAFGTVDQTAKIWWDVRPHPIFDTLEFRIADVCTTVDEAVCLVALIQAICAKLLKLHQQNLSWQQYRTIYVSENKWRAARYGIGHALIDFGRGEARPFHQLAQELIEFVDDVVDELGSRKEVAYVHTILKRGSSADRQLAVYHAHGGDDNREEALAAVVKHLIKETRFG